FLDLLLGFLTLFRVARHQQRDSTGARDLECRRLADPTGSSGDQHGFAVHRSLEAPVLEQIRVEVALPVVPQPRRVGLELGNRDAGAVQGALGVTRVELSRQADVTEHLVRYSEVSQDRSA